MTAFFLTKVQAVNIRFLSETGQHKRCNYSSRFEFHDPHKNRLVDFLTIERNEIGRWRKSPRWQSRQPLPSQERLETQHKKGFPRVCNLDLN